MVRRADLAKTGISFFGERLRRCPTIRQAGTLFVRTADRPSILVLNPRPAILVLTVEAELWELAIKMHGAATRLVLVKLIA